MAKQIDLFNILPREIDKLEDGSNLIYKPMEEVMSTSMLPYAEHVILDRALPRVEDGLKPVQRRILYSMYEQGVTADKAFRKSARIVGDCMGRYHPHGDSSIYDAMVRMAQPFSLSVPLINGQGNFGNVDGDGAAAMRYTEARLAPVAIELLRDIEKNTVRWSRNFDDTTKEPDMLPGRYPNLLVNGASGIAVGLATNIPPHNLAEVIDGVVAYIDNRHITLKNMMKIIKAPDFPTGGLLITGEGLEQAYETGKGKILIRAKIHIENAPNDRKNIVITELPYQVNKADLLIKIANLKDEKKDQLAGISEIVDESDKEGMRAVIKLKKDCDPQSILKVLFKSTSLETGFSINMVAIADGKPQQMGLLDIISYYTAYQREIILKRSRYELDEAKDREHILTGLVIAVQNIDEVIAIIKNANSTPDAKSKLRVTFDLTDRQAQAILDLRLARITKLETNKLVAELNELEKTITRLQAIINSKTEQMNLVKTELLNIKRTYKQARRSAIYGDTQQIVIESESDEKPIENVIIGIAGDYTIKRIPYKNFSMSNKDSVSSTSEVLISAVDTLTCHKAMIFSNYGNCYQLDISAIPECKLRDDGALLQTLFSEAVIGESPVAIFALAKDSMPEGELLFFTRQGMVKRSSWSEYGLLKSVFQGYKNKEDDEVFLVEKVKPDSQIFVVTNRGGCVKFNLSEVPQQGRIAGGVRDIILNEGEYVVHACQVLPDTGDMFMITNKAFAKRLSTKEIAIHGRGCKGAKGIDLSASNGTSIIFASYILDKEYNVAVYDKANCLLLSSNNYKSEGKATKGKAPKGKSNGIHVERVVYYKTEADDTLR